MKTKRASKMQKFGREELDAMLEDERQREFNMLVTEASAGDARAVGALAIALGPTLLEEARSILEEFEEEADEVLKDFLESLLERRFHFDLAYGDATPWMFGVVQGIAHFRCRMREREEEAEYE